jgi:uncharacterized protein DUF262
MMGAVNTRSAAFLEPRLVGDVEGTFFVRDYQRGYRWGPDEVRRLLDDINDARGRNRNYYLQPVVVKRLEDGRWELVDGQQRLTTLYLALRYIKRHVPTAEPRYRLSYETRPGSAAYLDSLDSRSEAASVENIDYFHMYEAFKCIGAWFGEHEHHETLAAIEFFTALSKSVYVIWYEAPDTPEFDSRALFTRLNVGRIPLSDAELVKALLLSRIARKQETAAQWDSIERDLHRSEVWAFATGTADGGPTRIGLLLDTIADTVVRAPAGRDRALYHTFETLRPRIEESPQDLWDEVVDLHSLVLGWYDDRDLFHKVGYLVAAGGASFLELVALARVSTKTGFDSALNGRLRESLNLSKSGVESLTYQTSTKTARALLLMNVETVRRRTQSSMRYSFDAQARRLWSFEHIHAQNSQGLSTVEQWTAWLGEHRQALAALDLPEAQLAALRERIDKALPTISSETFEPLHRELTLLFTAEDDASDRDDPGGTDHSEVDAVTNLALLARDDNSVLTNAVFEVKRRQVIALDRSGSYIPVCTRNVFLKYYTEAGAHQLHFWGPRDRQGYLAAMLAALDPYLLDDTPENDRSEDPDDLEESQQ